MDCLLSNHFNPSRTLLEVKEQALNENIFVGDDTLMVVTELQMAPTNSNQKQSNKSGGKLAFTLSISSGFANYDNAQKPIEAADYVTFEEA